MAGNDVHMAVANRDKRLLPVSFANPGRAKQAAMGGAGITLFDRVRTHSAGLV
jgi:hypothetical protein